MRCASCSMTPIETRDVPLGGGASARLGRGHSRLRASCWGGSGPLHGPVVPVTGLEDGRPEALSCGHAGRTTPRNDRRTARHLHRTLPDLPRRHHRGCQWAAPQPRAGGPSGCRGHPGARPGRAADGPSVPDPGRTGAAGDPGGHPRPHGRRVDRGPRRWPLRASSARRPASRPPRGGGSASSTRRRASPTS